MTAISTDCAERTAASWSDPPERLRALALRGLAQMYRPQERLFAFRARRGGTGVRLEGTSVRYTAIVLLGLAGESESAIKEVLGGRPPADVWARLLQDVAGLANLGDVALILWAARAAGHPDAAAALRRLGELVDERGSCETVELAWAVSALSAAADSEAAGVVRDRAARRLLQAFDDHSALFPHEVGASRTGLRGHVACFADLVYPIQALARYSTARSNAQALDVANRCAERMCALLGPAGQWWWHYDLRSGRVVERYPVYAVHQDAMAPMALFDLHEAGGSDQRGAIERGLAWLSAAPELNGRSLIDEGAGMIWRKVARREPRKLVRRAQAVATRIHPAFRWPGLDTLFPPGTIDAECRPYHLGWLLCAWSPQRAARWGEQRREN